LESCNKHFLDKSVETRLAVVIEFWIQQSHSRRLSG
jgi:hypothetical protein